MKHAQKYCYFSLLMGLVLLLSACQIGATMKNDNQAATKEATVELNPQQHQRFFMVTQELKFVWLVTASLGETRSHNSRISATR